MAASQLQQIGSIRNVGGRRKLGRQRTVALVLAVLMGFVGFAVVSPGTALADDALVLDTTGGETPSITTPPEEKTEPVEAAVSEEEAAPSGGGTDELAESAERPTFTMAVQATPEKTLIEAEALTSAVVRSTDDPFGSGSTVMPLEFGNTAERIGTVWVKRVGSTVLVHIETDTPMTESSVCVSTSPFTSRIPPGSCPFKQGATGTTATYRIDTGIADSAAIYLQIHVAIGGQTAFPGWTAGNPFFGNVLIRPIPPVLSVDVDKTNDANGDGTFTDSETAPAPNAPVTFQAVITNTSSVAVVLTSLTDRFPATGAPFNVCVDLVGQTLNAGASVSCNFTVQNYAPAAGTALVNTVRAVVAQPGNLSNTAADQDNSTVNTPVAPSPVLSITKTADAALVNAGSPIGFSITVANAGPGTATAVGLSDPLPGGAGVDWSISPAYAGPGTCSISGSPPNETLTCLFGDMASGASATVHVTSATTSATSGQFENTAFATSTNHPTVDDDARVTVVKPNLSIVKVAADPVVNGGSPIAFTVTVTNTGPGTATSVTLKDPLPPAEGVTWTISPSRAGCSISGTAPTQVLNCAFGDLASGVTAGVQVVSSTTSATSGILVNSATAAAGNHPPVVDDAQVVINRPGLSVTKTADATSVNSGSPIGFTVTVSNAGPGTATGVVLNDPLPAGTGINWSISPARAGCAITGAVGAQILACSFGDMAVAATASVHVVSATTAATSGTFTNTATASASNHGPVTAVANVIVNKPKMSITKTADAASVTAGSPIGFTVTVSNGGPDVANNLTVTDPLPGGLGLSWSISPATAGCSITGTAPSQMLACTVASMARGASLVVHVVSATTVNSVGMYNNVASTQADNHPVITANATTAVGAPASVAGVVIDRVAPGSTAPVVQGVVIDRAAPALTAPVVASAPASPASPAATAMAAAAEPATLPRTGSDPITMVFAGLLLIVAGFRLRRWGLRT